MAAGSDQVPTISSAAELMAVSETMEREAAARYGELAAAMAAAGNAEAASVLHRLKADKQGHGDAIARRASELDPRPAPAAMARQAGLVSVLDEMADEDPYTTTAYRVLGIAVRHEQQAFVFHANVAAHAPDQEVRLLAEGLAHEGLEHAAVLRRQRREAWRRTPNGASHRPPPPQSLQELQALAESLECTMAARHHALAETAAALGDLASADVLRSVATEALSLLPGLDRPAPAAEATVPANAGAFDLLRACLVDLEDAYDAYMRAAKGRAGEDAMLDAQCLAASATRRSGLIRGRLTVLGKVVQP